MEINKNELQNLFNEWLKFREEEISTLTEEDKKYLPRFEEKIPEILEYVEPDDKNVIRNILETMFNNMLDYSDYWNKKFYHNRF